MTQDDKQLLLKDLCARLPYGVKVKYLYWDENKGCEYPIAMTLDTINSDGYIRFHGDIVEGEGRGMLTQYLPYLRPMSSMTKKEDKEWQSYKCSIAESCDRRLEEKIIALHDWFNSRHLDWRGLIPKGLALEAKEGMYKTE